MTIMDKTRITLDEWGMRLAEVTSNRSTCCRRSVGCILVDKLGHLLSSGYNGVAMGVPHCNDMSVGSGARKFPHACVGWNAPSGKDLDACQAIHAEQNALLQCRDVQSIEACYTTTSPCVTCVKLLMNTGCRRIVFSELYPQPEARDMWMRSSTLRSWTQLERSGR